MNAHCPAAALSALIKAVLFDYIEVFYKAAPALHARSDQSGRI